VSLPASLAERLNRSQIPALDGLRAVAVFLVIFYHFGFEHIPGGYGVVMFFVLSGFLITWLLLKEQGRTGTISLTGFYRRRSLRIFPAFVVYWIALVGLLVLTGRPVNWPHAWSALLYVSNYYNAILGDPNTGFSHTWSLAIEEQFYLLWPFAFLLLRNSGERLARWIAGSIIAVWVYRCVLVYGFGVDQGYLYAAFDTRVDALMVGCLLAVVLHRGLFERFWTVVTSHPLLPLLTIGVIALGIFGGSLVPVARYRDVLGFAVVPPLMAVLIVQLIGLSDSPLWRWTQSAPSAFLGRISYPLYLWHQLTLGPVRNRLGEYPVVVQLAAALAVTILVATASYYIVERPFLRLKRSGPGPRPAEAPVATTEQTLALQNGAQRAVR
jgi:peptidoglycan/LPS O-acetylase OafA/YrhL